MRPLETGLTLRAYRLMHRLGRGGGGDVWLAVDTHGREVALKASPRAAGAEEQQLRQEFERLRTLHLPSVVRVLDVGSDQGYVFYTMEVAAGQPFDRFVAEGRTLAERVQRAAQAGAATARAMVGMHRLNLAHRDLKPANVFVADNGVVTVLDFGSIRFGAVEDESGNLTGTLAYMAPEQRVGLPHDHRVDRYALGLMLYDALAPGLGAPGRPRPTLLRLGREVPRPFAWLVERLLSLDPADRPGAEEAERVLGAIARGQTLPPAPWPGPPTYSGDASPLLSQSAIVVGAPGTGRRRMVEEARALWHRRGYRAIAGACAPDRPYGAIRAILAEVFAIPDPESRRRIAGDEAGLLLALWPELPVPGWAASGGRQPSPESAGMALGRALSRLAPLALVFWELDEADPGTAALLPFLVRALDPSVRVWATGHKPVPGLPGLSPPAWSLERDREILRGFLPDTATPGSEPARTPLQSAARAWRAFAATRGETGPALEIPPGLAALAVLDDPFPLPVALALCPEVDALWTRGHLALVRPEDYGLLLEGAQEARATWGAEEASVWLAFADPGTRRLAEAIEIDRTRLHLRAALAWEALPGVEARLLRGATHRLRAGTPDRKLFRRAVQAALDRANPGEAERWLQLKDLWEGGEDEATLALARTRAALEQRPARVSLDALDALSTRARTPEEKASVALLHLQWEVKKGDPSRAIQQGLAWARQVASDQPALAAEMLRQVVLARLDQDSAEEALEDGRRALVLAREAAFRAWSEGPGSPVSPNAPPPTPHAALTRVEVEVATTLSAALLYAGRTREGTRLCEQMAERCRKAGLARGQGAFLANLAGGQIFLGQRDAAAMSLARCREVQPHHGDPVILAYAAGFQARLAIERGDLGSGRLFLDEALTVAQSIGSGRILAEIWPLALEAAMHAADFGEAERALAAYAEVGVRSTVDHWPAVLARWRWLCGDLDGALAATTLPRLGHSGDLVAAERARLLLVQGDYAAAGNAGKELCERAARADFAELVLFGRLVMGVAAAAPWSTFGPLIEETRESRWVHLYLGALHLDALRRQLRRESPGPVLRELSARATDMNHTLYMALARDEAW